MVIAAEMQKVMVIITIMARKEITDMIIITDVTIKTIIIVINAIIEIINVFITTNLVIVIDHIDLDAMVAGN
jgi:hypothetical protein